MIQNLFSESFERRDKVQILADIIQVTSTETKMTRILRLANIQYNTFTKCIDKLCQSGLLRKIPVNQSDNRVKYSYKATDKGRKWCGVVSTIYQCLEDPTNTFL